MNNDPRSRPEGSSTAALFFWHRLKAYSTVGSRKSLLLVAPRRWLDYRLPLKGVDQFLHANLIRNLIFFQLCSYILGYLLCILAHRINIVSSTPYSLDKKGAAFYGGLLRFLF